MAVVVVVACAAAVPLTLRVGYPHGRGHVRERAIAVVAVERIGPVGVGHVDVLVAIAVEIEYDRPAAQGHRAVGLVVTKRRPGLVAYLREREIGGPAGREEAQCGPEQR